MNIQLECVKCGSAMEGGVIVDFTYGGKLQSRWVAGEPEDSLERFKTSNKAQYKAETYRCQGCGYLESYAIEETKESIFG